MNDCAFAILDAFLICFSFLLVLVTSIHSQFISHALLYPFQANRPTSALSSPSVVSSGDHCGDDQLLKSSPGLFFFSSLVVNLPLPGNQSTKCVSLPVLFC